MHVVSGSGKRKLMPVFLVLLPVCVPLGRLELVCLDVSVGPRHQTLRHAARQSQRIATWPHRQG